jgi:hypothetical protein
VSARAGWLRALVGLVRDVREVLAVAGVAALAEVSLRTSTLPVTARRLRVPLDLGGAAAPTDSATPVLPVTARRQVRAVRLVLGNWPFGSTCLRQSLVLGQRLRRLEPVLVVGVARGADASLAAHAWLVIGGHSLDPESERFAALAGRA